MNETPLFYSGAKRNKTHHYCHAIRPIAYSHVLALIVILLTSNLLKSQTPVFCAELGDTLQLKVEEVIGHLPTSGEEFSSVGQPQYGEATILASDTLRYLAPTKYFPVDSFFVTVCNSTGACEDISIEIEYVPSDQVFTRCDYIMVLKDQEAKGNALYNDLDFKGDALELEKNFLIPPQHGNVVINSDGSYTYTPNPGFVGTDDFSILCCTKNKPRFCEKNIITIQVVEEKLTCQTAMEAVKDCYSVGYFKSLSGNVLLNDVNFTIDVPQVNINLIEAPKLGSVSIQANGDFTYTHERLGYSSDVFKYEVCIDLPTCFRCDTGTVMIRMDEALYACQIWEASINDDVFEGCINQSLIGNVSSNDINYRLGNISYRLDPDFLPRNGQATMNGDGYVTFSPNSQWTGTDRFGYLACFGNGYCARATAHVTVKERVIPHLRDDTFNIDQQGCVNLNIFVNDVAIDGYDVNSFRIIEGGNNGQFQFVGSMLEYCPDPRFIGYDTITYELTAINSACQRSIKDTGRLFLNRLPFLELTGDFGLMVKSVEDYIQLTWQILPYCQLDYSAIIVNNGALVDTLFLSELEYNNEEIRDYRGWEQGTELSYKIIAKCTNQIFESQWVSVEQLDTEDGVFSIIDGHLYFSRPKMQPHDIQILTVDGKVVSSFKFLNGHRLPLRQHGVYIISYKLNGKIQYQKLYFNP